MKKNNTIYYNTLAKKGSLMNHITLDIPHRSCSFGSKELYFSSLAGLVHIAYGTALAVYKLVIYTYSLMTQGHFLPRYETAHKAVNDIQPWQHLGRGAILLIPIIGSLFFAFYDEDAKDRLTLCYLRMAQALYRAQDPRHQLIVDLYTVGYINRAHDGYRYRWRNQGIVTDMSSTHILNLCFKWELMAYAPTLSLILIKDNIQRAFPLRDEGSSFYKFKRSVDLLEKLAESVPDAHTNADFQEAIQETLHLYQCLYTLFYERPRHSWKEYELITRAELAYGYAQILQVRNLPHETEQTKNAFLEAANIWIEHSEYIKDQQRAAWETPYGLIATCFEKAGKPNEAIQYRDLETIEAPTKKKCWKERVDDLIILLIEGDHRADFINFINEFPENPQHLADLQDYLVNQAIFPNEPELMSHLQKYLATLTTEEKQRAKRNLRLNCHTDRLANQPDYVSSRKANDFSALFISFSGLEPPDMPPEEEGFVENYFY